MTNKQIEAAELEAWKGQPDCVTAYYDFPAERIAPTPDRFTWGTAFEPRLRTYGTHSNDAVLSTWPATLIGRIESARVYRHNFGGRIVSLRVKGTNGATYYGRASWDNGNVITLRKAKG